MPYVLVVGDDDVEHGTVGVNARGTDQPERGVPVDDFVARLAAEVDAASTREAARDPRRLWAGWRATYIDEVATQTRARRRRAACSSDSRRADPDEALVLARTDHAFAVMNAYPYTSGHLMVAPLRHVGDARRAHP